MLTKRVIPCLDVREGRVVKGIKFVNLRDAGDPVELAAAYDKAGADELVFLDITASYEKRGTMVEVASRTAEQVFIPYTVGGGIRSLEDIRKLLSAGADKVSLNTAAVQNPDLVREASRRYGCQCIVVAIDAKRIADSRCLPASACPPVPGVGRRARCWQAGQIADSSKREMGKPSAIGHKPSAKWEVYINGGRTPTGLDAVEWAKKVADLGAGEILLTSMDRDGTKDGYDIELTRAITAAVNIPVIASGGAGKLEHFLEVIVEADADAVLAASLFHYGELTIKQLKEYLRDNEVPVRL